MNILIIPVVSAGGSAWITATYYRVDAAELAVKEVGQKFSDVTQQIDKFDNEVVLINLSEMNTRDDLNKNQEQFAETMRFVGSMHADVGQLRAAHRNGR